MHLIVYRPALQPVLHCVPGDLGDFLGITMLALSGEVNMKCFHAHDVDIRCWQFSILKSSQNLQYSTHESSDIKYLGFNGCCWPAEELLQTFPRNSVHGKYPAIPPLKPQTCFSGGYVSSPNQKRPESPLVCATSTLHGLWGLARSGECFQLHDNTTPAVHIFVWY